MVKCQDPFITEETTLKNKKIEKSKTRKSKTRKSKKDKNYEKWNFAENLPLEIKVKIAQQLVKEINKAALASMMDAANQVFFHLTWSGISLLGQNVTVLLNQGPECHFLTVSPLFLFHLTELSSNNPRNRLNEPWTPLTDNLVCEPCVGCSTGCSCADGECFCANK